LRCLRASWFVEERGSGYCWLARLPGVPVSALRKDLVRERPPGTYSAAPSYMAMGIDCRAPQRKLASGILLVGPCERSRSETLPAHLGSVLGSRDPGRMGITTWSESAHLCRV